jgi:hypothetical protein
MAEDYPLSRYDLRLRSLDGHQDRYLCSRCDHPAPWSVWLHTPEWGPNGGATYVLCTPHALAAVVEEAGDATAASCDQAVRDA